jgi:choline kinase
MKKTMATVNECLILAAGRGSRIASVSGGVPKPLVPLRGIPLLEHVMTSCQEAGITRFVIVVGYRADQIRRWFADRPLDGISVTLIENSEYHKANGVSALAAKDELHNPFLLLMSDHIFEPKTVQALVRQRLGHDEVILAVDHSVDGVFDLDDATKVECAADHIVAIGKDLARYNALDTGMFLCSPALFHRLESAKSDGNCSLSDGMRQLAQEQKLRAFDIGDAHWQDVDSPEALAYAEDIFDMDFCENPFAESCRCLKSHQKQNSLFGSSRSP